MSQRSVATTYECFAKDFMEILSLGNGKCALLLLNEVLYSGNNFNVK